MITCTKKFENFPFAHRQHNHDGHCRLIHGHNWSFEFEFVTNTPDGNGFVIDFGKMSWLKVWLADHFDHTLVLNKDDPMLGHLTRSLTSSPLMFSPGYNLAKIITVPNGGAEGLARYVFDCVNSLLQDETNARVFLKRVTVFEDSKNSATYSQ